LNIGRFGYGKFEHGKVWIRRFRYREFWIWGGVGWGDLDMGKCGWGGVDGEIWIGRIRRVEFWTTRSFFFQVILPRELPEPGTRPCSGSTTQVLLPRSSPEPGTRHAQVTARLYYPESPQKSACTKSACPRHKKLPSMRFHV
jgi:hypothetical protein